MGKASKAQILKWLNRQERGILLYLEVCGPVTGKDKSYRAAERELKVIKTLKEMVGT